MQQQTAAHRFFDKQLALDCLGMAVVVFGAVSISQIIHHGWWVVPGWILFVACLLVRDWLRDLTRKTS